MYKGQRIHLAPPSSWKQYNPSWSWWYPVLMRERSVWLYFISVIAVWVLDENEWSGRKEIFHLFSLMHKEISVDLCSIYYYLGHCWECSVVHIEVLARLISNSGRIRQFQWILSTQIVVVLLTKIYYLCHQLLINHYFIQNILDLLNTRGHGIAVKYWIFYFLFVITNILI